MFEGITEVQKNNSILYFSASWCQPCKFLKPIMEEISDDNQHVDVFYIDVDEYQEFAINHQIRSVPTVMFFKDEEIVHSFVGLSQKENIQNAINENFGGINE